MCLTGERVPAQDAYRYGLVNHVHTREELLPAARATIDRASAIAKE